MSSRYKHFLFVLLSVFFLWGCGGNGDGDSDETPEEEPTIQELAMPDLLAVWRIEPKNGVSVDGQDVTAEYAGFTLTMDQTTYNTTNGANLFDAVGTWQWVASDTDLIMDFSDGKRINIQTLTSSQLVLNFQFAGAGGARAGIAGSYVLNLSK